MMRGDDGIERPTTESDLARQFMRQGVKDNSAFLTQDFMPKFEDEVRRKLIDAASSEELLNAQGALKLLERQRQFIRERLKPQKGIVT